MYHISHILSSHRYVLCVAGWAEISEFQLVLESTPPFNDTFQFRLLPLHSGIPSKDQRQVFLTPPTGVRKIILATNIGEISLLCPLMISMFQSTMGLSFNCSDFVAETSLTIEDVAFVIDTGRAKEKSYDPHLKTSTLQESWISQASAKQRRGRAGEFLTPMYYYNQIIPKSID